MGCRIRNGDRQGQEAAHMLAIDVLGGVAVEAVLDETLRIKPVQNRVCVCRQLVRVHHQLVVLRHLSRAHATPGHALSSHPRKCGCTEPVQLQTCISEQLSHEESHLAEEILCPRAFEGAPAAAARPVAVYQRVVQVQHQRPHMPAHAASTLVSTKCPITTTTKKSFMLLVCTYKQSWQQKLDQCACRGCIVAACARLLHIPAHANSISHCVKRAAPMPC